VTDIYSAAKRSEVMAKIRGKDTVIERRLRSALHRFGLRFRLNASKLPGRPEVPAHPFLGAEGFERHVAGEGGVVAF
jgi:G:T-mismatch repair DNA endonuclease (very short patch repair protein)